MTRFAAEIVTALVTLGLGAAVVTGSLEYGTGWNEGGPQPGAFPFYVGLLVVAASAGSMLLAVRNRRPGVVLVTTRQARRIAAFALPMLAFVAVALTLGFYVAAATYLAAVMRFQGRYRIAHCIAVGVGASAFFYLVLEVWFKVPLLKGPLEALLRLH